MSIQRDQRSSRESACKSAPRSPLCPVCDAPARFMGLVRARKWYYCPACEVEFESRRPDAGKGGAR